MELFDSYSKDNAVYCDVTGICYFDEPNARIFCHEVSNLCGFCGDLIVANGLVLCDCGDSWNCNLCGNDLPFWIPYQEGDYIDFQFQQPDEVTGVECMNSWLPANLLSPTNTAFATFEILTCCDDTPLELTEIMFDIVAPNRYVGDYINTNYSGTETSSSIQMIRFNLDVIRQYLEAAGLETCFYFNFTFTNSRFCLGVSESSVSFCSEPFKYDYCGDATVVIESDYPKKDCFDMYYGSNFSGLGGFQYSNKIRVPGFFEQASFNITKETINTSLKTTMSQKSEIWQLRTTHLPQSFVKNLVNILSGKNVYVNGVEYQVQGDINRNNETGLQW
jgi:hypothetical protein